MSDSSLSLLQRIFLAQGSPGWTELAVATKDAAIELVRKGPTSAEGSPSPPGELEGAPPDSFRKDVGPPVNPGLLAQPASLESG